MKKPPMMAAESFVEMFAGVSRAALVDALWCACQLGTDETTEEITTQAARNVQIALRHRDDVIRAAISRAAAGRLDSDPE